jgi:predicted NAD/FAD-dependent oxidoreductase
MRRLLFCPTLLPFLYYFMTTMTLLVRSARGMATPATQQQQPQKVAVIGGGIAGLSCAQHLGGSQQYDVTVFDTGRLRPGGRCSTRQPGDAPKQEQDDDYPLLSKYRFDHAAQLISANNHNNILEDFQQQLLAWEKDGIVTKFPPNSVCRVARNGKIEPLSQDFYHGTQGMGGLALSLVDQTKNFELKQDVWVSPSSGVRYQKDTGKWKLQANGKSLGIFDQLVIAHNGKCADRIMSKTPAKDVHALLRVNFNPTVPAHGGNKMTLNSIYSLTICLDKESSPLSNPKAAALLPEGVISAFCDHPSLRMMTCQTRKYPNNQDDDDGGGGGGGGEHEVWTILSSAKFAKKYKAPQEFLPEETIEEVSSLLLEAVQELLSLGGTIESPTIKPLEKRLQLWGAGVPLNVWNNNDGYIYDPENKVGVCGDWLVEPSIAGAWTSGRLLAKHLLETPKEKTGLEGKFERSESASKLGIASLTQ